MPLAALEKAADAAWRKYGSTVRMGGTPEQRQWACAAAVKVEEQLQAARRAEAKVALRKLAAAPRAV